MEGNELGAAFGLQQLKNLKDNIKVRRLNFQKQISFFKKYKDYFINPKETPGIESGWLAFPILINSKAPFSRKEFQIFLESNNIQTRVVFTGNILKQPMSKHFKKKILDEGYPNADNIMKNGVLLPIHHGMTDEMFKKLHGVIEIFLNKKISN